MQKPRQSDWGLLAISFGNFGTAIAFALQGANMSRIFQTLGAEVDKLAILMIAGPVTGLIVQPLVGHYSDRTWGRWAQAALFSGRCDLCSAGAGRHALCAMAVAGGGAALDSGCRAQRRDRAISRLCWRYGA